MNKKTQKVQRAKSKKDTSLFAVLRVNLAKDVVLIKIKSKKIAQITNGWPTSRLEPTLIFSNKPELPPKPPPVE